MQNTVQNPALQAAIRSLQQAKLAARRYEKEGHGKFRDCLFVCCNGRVLFQLFSYGEAASLVFEMWAKNISADGAISWADETVAYSGKTEAPQKLTSFEDNVLYLDDRPQKWAVAAEYKTFAKAGLGGLGMLWRRVAGKG